MRASVYTILISMTFACGPSLPDEDDEIAAATGTESGPAEDGGTVDDTSDPCDPDSLQGSPCDPHDVAACPGGNCALHGGPVIIWACEMKLATQPDGAPCVFNGECDDGVCVPMQYHPSPDEDANVGACGISCITESDCAAGAICQPGIEDINGIQWSICLNV